MTAHEVDRYDPYGAPEYAGLRVDGAYVFNDAISDDDLRAQVERAQAVLDYRAAERLQLEGNAALVPKPRTATGPTTYDGEHRCAFPEVIVEQGRDPEDALTSGAHVLAPCSCGETPLDHLSIVEGHNRDLEAAVLAQEPHRALYHWAPRTRRGQITRYGLRPNMRVTTSTGLPVAGVICLADSPSWAWALSGDQRHAPHGRWDLWQTSLDVLQQPIVLPSRTRRSGLHEVRTEHRIYKRHLWLVATREKP